MRALIQSGKRLRQAQEAAVSGKKGADLNDAVQEHRARARPRPARPAPAQAERPDAREGDQDAARRVGRPRAAAAARARDPARGSRPRPGSGSIPASCRRVPKQPARRGEAGCEAEAAAEAEARSEAPREAEGRGSRARRRGEAGRGGAARPRAREEGRRPRPASGGRRGLSVGLLGGRRRDVDVGFVEASTPWQPPATLRPRRWRGPASCVRQSLAAAARREGSQRRRRGSEHARQGCRSTQPKR